MSSHVPTDIVPPTRLMEIAHERLNVSLRIVGMGDTSYVPTALAVSTAIHEATSGIGALQSALIPSTPWGLRQRSASAMSQTRRALTQLELYRDAVGPLGERPLERSDLQVGTLALLDTARSALRVAARNLP
jgi:hypothetical protein